MITPAQLARAVYIADAGAADRLRELLRRDPRGRKSAFERHGAGDVYRLFAIGMYLAGEHRHSQLVDDAYEVLTEDLSRPDQHDLGILEPDPKNPDGLWKPFPIDRFYYVSRSLVALANYSADFFPELKAAERVRREDLVYDFVDTLLVTTLYGVSTRYHAMDGTGAWSWAKGRSRRKAEKKQVEGKGQEEWAALEVVLDPQAPDFDPDAARAYLEELARQLQPLADDPDADWGVKTRKDGGVELYFGGQLSVICRTPAPDEAREELGKRTKVVTVPQIVAMGRTRASLDVRDMSLKLIDRVRARECMRNLLVDRLYSNWVWERWGRELVRRGIRQHVDMTKNDHGFRDYNGARLARGWMWCPGCPDHHGTKAKPAPNARSEEWSAFFDDMDDAALYAMVKKDGPDEDGIQHWVCPVLAGKPLGCPNRPESVPVALRLGHPVVQNPPAIVTDEKGNRTPLCCTQGSVTTRADAQVKLAQPRLWGTRAWHKITSLRTYIEGVFGNMKDPSTEGVSRGKCRLRGGGAHLVCLSFAGAAYNVRIVRTLFEEIEKNTGDWPANDHPLYQRDPEYHGFDHLVPAEAAEIDRQWSRRLLGGDAAA